jgi:hypothetical protein
LYLCTGEPVRGYLDLAPEAKTHECRTAIVERLVMRLLDQGQITMGASLDGQKKGEDFELVDVWELHKPSFKGNPLMQVGMRMMMVIMIMMIMIITMIMIMIMIMIITMIMMMVMMMMTTAMMRCLYAFVCDVEISCACTCTSSHALILSYCDVLTYTHT